MENLIIIVSGCIIGMGILYGVYKLGMFFNREK